ncbi:MAG: hypothetical protein LIO62_07415, partial [Clostridiales bacterium]|nr:hypothetical protein [Clostridiales bacterium]
IYRGNVMNNDTLLKALKENSMTFTAEEINQMMNDELNKDPQEMDTELIDICTDILSDIYFNADTETENAAKVNDSTESRKENKTTSKRIKLGKALLIAAVIVIITSIAVPVGARYVHNEVSDKIVQFFSDNFKIDLRSGNKSAISHSDENIYLIKQLNQAGFESVILPGDLLNNTYSENDITISDEEDCLSAEIDFKIDDISGYICITEYKNDELADILNQSEIGEQYDSVEQLTLNGMDILIFNHDDISFIEYADNNIEYSIHLENCSLDSAVKIAESLQ